jgi:hypothetical protein
MSPSGGGAGGGIDTEEIKQQGIKIRNKEKGEMKKHK